MMVSLLTHICATRPQWVKRRLIAYWNGSMVFWDTETIWAFICDTENGYGVSYFITFDISVGDLSTRTWTKSVPYGRSVYSALSISRGRFIHGTHNGHTITRPSGWSMVWFLWVLLLTRCMQYRVILDRDISRVDCMVTLVIEHNDRFFADDIFMCIFLERNFFIVIQF